MNKNDTVKLLIFQSLEVNRTRDIDLLLQTFYSGREENLTAEEKAVIRDYATRWRFLQLAKLMSGANMCCFSGKKLLKS